MIAKISWASCVGLLPLAAQAAAPQQAWTERLTPAQHAKVRAFQAQHPQSDYDKDGALTPSEILRFRVSFKKRKGPEARQAEALLRATYTPAPVEAGRTYGPAPGKRIKLFILSGQSNMVGQGMSAELPDASWRGSDRVLMFENGVWQPLRPLRYKFGPEISFAHAIAKAWPDETIGIVKQAYGGTGVLAWSPTWTKEKADLTRDGHKGNLWKALTDKVRAAREAAPCDAAAFVWKQGGKDTSKLAAAEQYLDNLKALIDALRRELDAADMPAVIGSPRYKGTPDDVSEFDFSVFARQLRGRPGIRHVLQAHYEIQKVAPPAVMVRIPNLPKVAPGNVHFNTEGQLMQGQLLAAGYLGFVNR